MGKDPGCGMEGRWREPFFENEREDRKKTFFFPFLLSIRGGGEGGEWHESGKQAELLLCMV